MDANTEQPVEEPKPAEAPEEKPPPSPETTRPFNLHQPDLNRDEPFVGE